MPRQEKVDFIRRAPRRSPLTIPVAVGGSLLTLAVATGLVVLFGKPFGGVSPLNTDPPLTQLGDELVRKGAITSFDRPAVTDTLMRLPDGMVIICCNVGGELAAEEKADAMILPELRTTLVYGRFTFNARGGPKEYTSLVRNVGLKLDGAKVWGWDHNARVKIQGVSPAEYLMKHGQ